MTPGSTNGRHRHQIEFSAALAATVRNLQQRATRENRGEEFLAAFRRIVAFLQSSPNSFGESLYRLPALRLRVRCAAVRQISIDFAVSEDRPVVYIKSVRLMSKL